MDMNEKKRRKEQYALERQKEFEASLPISREFFEKLFDFLEEQSQEVECNHNFDLTIQFLQKHKSPVNPVLNWLKENGAGCDCEVIFNVEEQFE